MKKIIFLLALIINYNAFGQKTGVVYNINPKAGYAYFEGILKPRPILQDSIDYNFISFLTQHLDSLNIQTEVKQNFDFNQLLNFQFANTRKKEAEYCLKYCEQNGLDKLIILRKNNAYSSVNPMQTFFGLEHDFGLATFKIEKKTASFYYNFLIITYTKGEKRLMSSFGSSYFSRKCKEDIYGEIFLLKDDKVFNELLPIFETKIKEGLEEVLITTN